MPRKTGTGRGRAARSRASKPRTTRKPRTKAARPKARPRARAKARTETRDRPAARKPRVQAALPRAVARFGREAFGHPPEQQVHYREAWAWCEAAMWARTACQLAQTEVSGREIDRILHERVYALFLDFLDEFLSSKEWPRPISYAEIEAFIERCGTESWSTLPPVRGRSNLELPPIDTLELAPYWLRVFDELHREVVGPYRREFGEKVWSNGAAFRRILDPEHCREPVDGVARAKLATHGADLAALEDRKFRDWIAPLLTMRPSLAAVEVCGFARTYPAGRKLHDTYLNVSDA